MTYEPTAPRTDNAPKRLLLPRTNQVWTRRMVDPSGEGRYAPAGITNPMRWALERYSVLVGTHDARVLPETPGVPGSGSRKPGLSFGLDAAQLHGVLRVDAIQRATLVGLAAMCDEPGADDDILTALAELARAAAHGSPEALDARVEALADAACLDYPTVTFTLADARRLRDELNTVIEKLARFAPETEPQPRGGQVA